MRNLADSGSKHADTCYLVGMGNGWAALWRKPVDASKVSLIQFQARAARCRAELDSELAPRFPAKRCKNARRPGQRGRRPGNLCRASRNEIINPGMPGQLPAVCTPC